MKTIKKFLSILIPDKSDVLLFSGLSLLGYGVYQVNEPLSFIIVGTLLMAIAYLQILPKKE
ncbi:hypothetical protein KAR91_41395 [Candidatus Pacearchaeota archaeon]|nr:hypothetical protein [Candidatus Pacearchaeota archaeon]